MHFEPEAVKGYDPAFGYEMAAIIENGVKEMWGEAAWLQHVAVFSRKLAVCTVLDAWKDKDVIYYVTAYNENFAMPEKPEAVFVNEFDNQ